MILLQLVIYRGLVQTYYTMSIAKKVAPITNGPGCTMSLSTDTHSS